MISIISKIMNYLLLVAKSNLEILFMTTFTLYAWKLCPINDACVLCSWKIIINKILCFKKCLLCIFIFHSFILKGHRQEETILPNDIRHRPQEISSFDYHNQPSPKSSYRGTGGSNKSDVNTSQEEDTVGK